MPLTDLNPERRDALHEYRLYFLSLPSTKGESWKKQLLQDWLVARYFWKRSDLDMFLQQIRNNYGPSWLSGLKEPEFEWTLEDQAQAQAEGWDLFLSEGNLRLERLDEAEVFSHDGEAWRWVLTQSSPLTQKALAILRVESPAEYRTVLSC